MYERLTAHLTQEIDQKKFKIEKMPDYIQRAKEYAGTDSELLERITSILDKMALTSTNDCKDALIISQKGVVLNM